MKRLENILDITRKLCGNIEPQGESNIDVEVLQNLQDTIKLTEGLIDDIILIARYKYNPLSSIQKIGLEADKFIEELQEQLNEWSIERWNKRVNSHDGKISD